jgi:hypothetical protein
MIFFYMRQQSTNWQWRIEKPLKFSGIWENFVQPPHLQCTYILFRFSECLDQLLEKKKISPFPYPVLPPEICNMIFFLNPEFHKFIKLLRWMKTRKGLTFLCYKNELGHKQLL